MMKNILFIMALFIFFTGISYAATSLTNCTNISSSGDYVLTSNAQDGNINVTSSVSPIGGEGLACFVIDASDVNFDCAGFKINKTSNDAFYGIFINDSVSGVRTNVTILNCKINDYKFGIYGYNVSSSTFSSNTINTTSISIGIVNSTNLNVLSNALTTRTFGFTVYMENSTNSVISDNFIYNLAVGAGGGLDVEHASNISILNNFGIGAGILSSFYFKDLSDSSIATNIATQYAGGDMTGVGLFNFLNSSRNVISDNIAYDGAFADGYLLSESSQNNLSGNVATNNSEGFYVNSNSNTNILLANTMSLNSGCGIDITDSAFNQITSNTILQNGELSTQSGICLEGVENSTLDSNSISNSGDAGVEIFNSLNISLLSNVISSNFHLGLDLHDSIIYSYSNTLTSNNQTGTFITNSNITSNLDSFASHNADLYIDGGSIINFSTATFVDGNTVLSIYDNNTTNSYTIKGTSVPTSLPTGLFSLASKALNITNLSAVTLPSIIWYWSDGEVGNRDENKFVLYKYNESWNDTNAIRDTTQNSLSLSDISTFSIFAVLTPDDGTGTPNKPKTKLKLTLDWDILCGKNIATLNGIQDAADQVDVRVLNFNDVTVIKTLTVTGANNKFDFDLKDSDRTDKIRISTSGSSKYEDLEVEKTFNTACNLKPKLKINIVSTSCNKTTLTVVDQDGNPVANADILIKITGQADQTSKTDGKGEFSVLVTDKKLCGQSITMQASAAGYDTSDVLTKMIDCNACIQPPACTEDGNCKNGFKCVNKMCVPAMPPACKTSADCKGGQSCNPQGMCTDTKCTDTKDCLNGGRCMGGICKVDNQCTTNSDCASTEICSGGSCTKPQIACGEVKDHVIINYECGEGCQPCAANYICSPKSRKCIFGNITGPKSGYNGDSVSFYSWIGSNITPCINCIVEVKDPTGTISTYTTNAKGNIALLPNVKGQYNLTLLIDDLRISNTTYIAKPKGNFVDDLLKIDPLVCLALLILVIILAVLIYQRTRNNNS